MSRLVSVALATLCLAALALGEHDGKIIPAGTQLQIRTNEAIDSKTAGAGQTYSALVEQDVTDNTGAMLIPKGSGARLVIRKASGGGTFGSSQLVLDLASVTVDGRPYQVSTADLEQKNQRGIGKNRRTAEMVGGGAAVGTVIGAIGGGGKGAAIGAIVGAAAGGTAQVLTKGKQVRVPAETVLTFRLDQPLKLTASS